MHGKMINFTGGKKQPAHWRVIDVVGVQNFEPLQRRRAFTNPSYYHSDYGQSIYYTDQFQPSPVCPLQLL